MFLVCYYEDLYYFGANYVAYGVTETKEECLKLCLENSKCNVFTHSEKPRECRLMGAEGDVLRYTSNPDLGKVFSGKVC
jgi:hypothetical protein